MHRNKQHGAVLVVSLMLLLVMTLLGLSGMQGTILEEKMSGNMRDRNTAFQAAEIAMFNAEEFLDSIISISDFGNGANGLYADGPSDPDYFATSTWTSARSYSGTVIPGVNTQPLYVIKHVGEVNVSSGARNIGGYSDKSAGGAITTFRITTRGTGGSDVTQVILQTYFGRRF